MSEKFEMNSFKNAEEIARAAAERWIGALRERDIARSCGVALSGGRIAKAFYAQVAEKARAASISWDNVHFFWADERCVPPTDSESNYATAREYLFNPLGIPARNVHRIIGEMDPAEAADQAQSELCRIMPRNDFGQPVFDLIFLGMGEDGHVASLFPGEEPEFRDSPRVYRSVVAPKPPARRITLGYWPIFAAREVWVLASGPGKIEAFKRLFLRDLTLPVVQIIEHRSQTVIFEDSSYEYSQQMLSLN